MEIKWKKFATSTIHVGGVFLVVSREMDLFTKFGLAKKFIGE